MDQEYRMHQQRELARLEDEETRNRSQFQTHAQHQPYVNQSTQQLRAELREEEARLKSRVQQLEYEKMVAMRVKEQIDKTNQAQEARMDKLQDLLINNANRDTSHKAKDPPTYQRHTKAAQPAKFKGEGEKLLQEKF